MENVEVILKDPKLVMDLTGTELSYKDKIQGFVTKRYPILEVNNNVYHYFIDYDEKTNKMNRFFLTSYNHIISPLIFDDVEKITIFHHNDLDGEFSAAIMKEFLNIQKFDVHEEKSDKKFLSIDFVKYNYKGKDVDKQIEEDLNIGVYKSKLAIIVDLSLVREQLEKIFESYEHVIWIDHHGTSLKLAKEMLDDKAFKNDLNIILDSTISATYICYILMGEEIQNSYKIKNNRSISGLAARIASDYDTWNMNNLITYKMGVYLNQYYFAFNSLPPVHPFYSNILFGDTTEVNKNLTNVITTGEKLYSLDQLKNDMLYNADAKYVAYSEKFKYRAVGLFGYGNSFRFVGPDDKESIMLLMRLDHGEITVSAYTENEEIKKIDLGRILREEFNGGGHPGAAGFNSNTTDFKQYIDKAPNKIITDAKIKFSIEGSQIRKMNYIAAIFETVVTYIFSQIDRFNNEK